MIEILLEILESVVMLFLVFVFHFPFLSLLIFLIFLYLLFHKVVWYGTRVWHFISRPYREPR